ncbi:MAG: hypothetical protein JWP81_4346 [Ferruginibacter sp.]|nr:hypothetical protein [Ferruginibacter sp.]
MYCLYILIRGAVAGFYPYPFIDVNSLGYNQVFLNICGMVIVFLVVSFVLIAIARIASKKKRPLLKTTADRRVDYRAFRKLLCSFIFSS